MSYLCAVAPQMYQEACRKTGEATYVYTGASKREEQIIGHINDRGKHYLGNRVWTIGAVMGAIAYKGIVQKSLSYKVNLRKTGVPFVDFIEPRINYGSKNIVGYASIGFFW